MTEALPFPRREFYMVRHGQSKDGANELVSSEHTHLTLQGLKEAASLRMVFKALFPKPEKSYVVTSALPRAIDTGSVMIEGDETLVMAVDPRLNERKSGVLGGTVSLARLDNIKKYLGDRAEKKAANVPGAETREAHRAHVLEAMKDHLTSCPPERIPVIISHQGTMTRAGDVAGYHGVRFKNAGMYHFKSDNSGGWTISEVLLQEGKITELPLAKIPTHELEEKGINI